MTVSRHHHYKKKKKGEWFDITFIWKTTNFQKETVDSFCETFQYQSLKWAHIYRDSIRQ